MELSSLSMAYYVTFPTKNFLLDFLSLATLRPGEEGVLISSVFGIGFCGEDCPKDIVLLVTMSKDENLVEDEMQIDQHDSDRPQKNVPDGFSEDYLKVYYGKLFPCVDIYRWLSYGNDGKHPACDQSYFGRREFSFTLENDIYLRFLSFNNVVEMESSIRKKCPFKIDIGPVYTPAKRRAYAQGGNNVFSPIERELVFDIDMSDYDDVRYCCSGADVCLDCWPLMNVAIKVLDMSLRGLNYWITRLLRILVSITSYGYIVVAVVSIVGFVMEEQEGLEMSNEHQLLNTSMLIRSFAV
ncbi:hypothetical protein ZIOFF_016505 [Zingiber officinale]|uniref:DNA primase n=1 Tax=Zingiber officinale TaxID=94328 RepID=A0A8J5LQY7_ZINOF|nr:hypothetical protein ZIOFF_016505 [Zingiber officinale]